MPEIRSLFSRRSVYLPLTVLITVGVGFGLAAIRSLAVPRDALWSTVTIEALVATLALPLTADLASRAQDRYGSKQLASYVTNDWWFSALRALVLPFAFLTVAFLFFFRESNQGYWWNSLAFFSLANLAVVVVLFTVFVSRAMRMYLGGPSWALDRLLGEAELQIQGVRDGVDFLEIVRAAGNVVAYGAQSESHLDVVEDGLEGLRNLFSGLLELQRADSPRFSELAIAEELRAKDPDTQVRLVSVSSLAPDMAFVGYGALADAMARVHTVAVKSGNMNAARAASVSLSSTLQDACKRPLSPGGVQIVLGQLRSSARAAMKAGDSSARLLTYEWYVSLAFESVHWGGVLLEPRCLVEVAPSLLGGVKTVVRERDAELFRGFVGLAHDGAGSHRPERGYVERFWDLSDLPEGVLESDRYRWLDLYAGQDELLERMCGLRTVEELEKWRSDVVGNANALQEAFGEELPDSVRQRLKELAVESFLALAVNGLQLVMIDVAVYCIFLGRFEFLEFLLQYHEPADSDGLSTGWDPFPRELGDILDMAMILNRRRGFIWFEDHHGSRRYEHQLAVLLLALAESPPSGLQVIPASLRNISPDSLPGALRLIGQLVETADQLARKPEGWAPLFEEEGSPGGFVQARQTLQTLLTLMEADSGQPPGAASS